MGLGYDLHIDQALTNFSIGYNPAGPVANIVCPRVPVTQDSGTFWKFYSEGLKQTDTYRADKAPSNKVTLNATSASYIAKGHALHHLLSKRDLDRTSQPLDLIYVRDLMNRLAGSLEQEVATLFTTYTNYGTGATVLSSTSGYHTCSGSEQFNASGGASDPLELIDAAILWVYKSCGIMPNTIIIPIEVGQALMRIPNIMQHIMPTSSQLLTSGAVPDRIRNLQVVQPGFLKDATVQGQTGLSLSEMWGDNIVVCYVDPNVNTEMPCFAKNFTVDTGGQPPQIVNRIPQPDAGSPLNPVQKIEVDVSPYIPTITCNTAGYLIRDVLA